MKISGVTIQHGEYKNDLYSKIQIKGNEFTQHMSTAYKKVEKQESGEILGLTMFKEPGTNCFWGMKAKYAECSTKDNPVIYVETNYGGEKASYNININEIDPNNASRLEIFALCSYADDTGIGDNSTFGTYNTLRSYEEMAEHNGYIDSQMKELNTFEKYKNEKLDWTNMSRNVMDLLYKCKDFSQYKKGIDIINLFSKYPTKY